MERIIEDPPPLPPPSLAPGEGSTQNNLEAELEKASDASLGDNEPSNAKAKGETATVAALPPNPQGGATLSAAAAGAETPKAKKGAGKGDKNQTPIDKAAKKPRLQRQASGTKEDS